MTKLTLKERAFVDAYCGSCAGNATQAARAAGYRQSPKALAVTASRLLRKANIAEAILARTERARRESILTADERDKILSDIADGSSEESHARIAAIKELNKCAGRHSIRHVVDLNFDPMKYLAEKTPEDGR